MLRAADWNDARPTLIPAPVVLVHGVADESEMGAGSFHAAAEPHWGTSLEMCAWRLQPSLLRQYPWKRVEPST